MATTTVRATNLAALNPAQLALYRRDGHLTVPGVFDAGEIDAALADLEAWSAAELAGMSEEERAWYVDAGVPGAPVPRGGVSFHHGNTLHQSADNRSPRWRRACAMHYVSAGTDFVNPALDYDDSLVVAVP